MRLRNIPRAESTIEAHDGNQSAGGRTRESGQRYLGIVNQFILRLGWGKGQFLLNMALAHPDVNYIGIERYSSVLLRAVEKFDRDEYRELENIRFICMDAKELDKSICAGRSGQNLSEFFSDPWPKARHAKRRLTSERIFEKI